MLSGPTVGGLLDVSTTVLLSKHGLKVLAAGSGSVTAAAYSRDSAMPSGEVRITISLPAMEHSLSLAGSFLRIRVSWLHLCLPAGFRTQQSKTLKWE